MNKLFKKYDTNSLAGRLTAWYAGSAFVLILCATGVLYFALVHNMETEDDEFLENKIEHLKSLISEEKNNFQSPVLKWELTPQHYPKFFVRILDSSGRTVLETKGMPSEITKERFPKAEAFSEISKGKTITSLADNSYRLLAEKTADNGIIQVAMDRENEEQLLNKYREVLFWILVSSILACAWVGYRIAYKGIHPVNEIVSAAGKITSSTLHERIEKKELPSELMLLAETFNGMLDRLEESFTRISQFSDDIAHELRTPINNIRGQAEVALGRARSAEEYRETLESCLEECVRISQMIHSLLFLSRAENPQTQISKEEVEISRELDSTQEFYEASAQEAGVSLKVVSVPELKVFLDRILFQRAVGNLLSNAISYTPVGGLITLTASKEDHFVRIKVSDTGRGISPEHLPHVFDRLYRVDQVRTTSSGNLGLGLAMVKSIANLHGGSVDIRSVLGKGTEVTLRFPVG